jgi:adenylate kinase
LGTQINVLLLGPQGSGKGTQAKRIAQEYGLAHVATGDMFRAAIARRTDLGRKVEPILALGKLVPDELTISLIRERLREPDARDGFILDGFPRTVAQAKALTEELERVGRQLTAALLIDVTDEEVVRRISGRRQCVKNEQHIYHVDFDPPKHPDVCDQDGARLIQRDDDKPDTVKHRLEVYHEQTEPVIGYYEEQGLLRRFEGDRTPTEVHDHIRATLATLRLEDQL